MNNLSATTNKNQIAIVYDSYPYPIRSGDNFRIAEMIRVLRANGFTVHLIMTTVPSLYIREMARRHVDKVVFYFEKSFRNYVRIVTRTIDAFLYKHGLPKIEEMLGAVLGKKISITLKDYWLRYPRGLDRFLAAYCRNNHVATVIIQYIWLYKAVQKLGPDIRTIIDTHDIQYLRVREFAAVGRTFPLKITRRQEADILSNFDAILAIQEEEKRIFETMCPRTRVIKCGVSGELENMPGSNPTIANSEKVKILTVGGYNEANVDGLLRFLELSWPVVRENNPTAELYIVGNICKCLFNRPLDSRIHVFDYVENTDELLSTVDIIINPLWIGTGLKIKTVEALQHGLPLVTTTKGVEGLDPAVFEACVVEDDEKAFGEELLALADHAERRENLRQAAEAFASRYLSTSAVYRELLEFLRS